MVRRDPKGVNRWEWKDENDPLNYIGDQYKFLEEDGYINNVRTKLHFKPSKFPLDRVWESLVGSSYHKTTWVPADNKRDDTKSRRRIERDPNHPMWEPRYGLLRWWHIRISLLGSDREGKQWVMIRRGQGEPLYLHVGRTIELYYKGKKVNLQED